MFIQVILCSAIKYLVQPTISLQMANIFCRQYNVRYLLYKLYKITILLIFVVCLFTNSCVVCTLFDSENARNGFVEMKQLGLLNNRWIKYSTFRKVRYVNFGRNNAGRTPAARCCNFA